MNRIQRQLHSRADSTSAQCAAGVPYHHRSVYISVRGSGSFSEPVSLREDEAREDGSDLITANTGGLPAPRLPTPRSPLPSAITSRAQLGPNPGTDFCRCPSPSTCMSPGASSRVPSTAGFATISGDAAEGVSATTPLTPLGCGVPPRTRLPISPRDLRGTGHLGVSRGENLEKPKSIESETAVIVSSYLEITCKPVASWKLFSGEWKQIPWETGDLCSSPRLWAAELCSRVGVEVLTPRTWEGDLIWNRVSADGQVEVIHQSIMMGCPYKP